MNIIERIKAKTPIHHKRAGINSTMIGTVCAGVLATGVVTNPIGIVALTIGSIVFGVRHCFTLKKRNKHD